VEAPFGCDRKASRSAVEIALHDLHQRRFDRDPAVLAALAADVDDRALVGAAKVTDVGAQQFIGAASSAVRIRARSRSIQSLRRRGCGSELRVARSAVTESVGRALGSVLASLGRPTNGIGLDAITSAV